MSPECLHTKPRVRVPHFNSVIPRGRKEEVSVWHKFHAGDVMLVTLQGLEYCVSLEVPELYSHVCRTRGQYFTLRVEGNVVNVTCVGTKSLLVVTRFKVPYFDSGILAGSCYNRVGRMQLQLGNLLPMAGQSEFLRDLGQSFASHL
jgi:hypothetical protein